MMKDGNDLATRFYKKTQKTPKPELDLAKKRKKEVERND